MSFEIGLLPSGHLHCYWSSTESEASNPEAQLARAFTTQVGEGLFTLVAKKLDTGLSPTLIYWRRFANQYLSARCLLTPMGTDQTDLLEPFGAEETMPLLLAAPPMPGAEYLSATALQAIWTDLDHWFCAQIQAFGSLAWLLKKRAPQWHQVGRVCFHLQKTKTISITPLLSWRRMCPSIPGGDGSVTSRLIRPCKSMPARKTKKH